MKRQQIRLLKGLSGYPLQSINLKLLDMKEEVATAVAIPSKNIIVCIDIGYEAPSGIIGMHGEEYEQGGYPFPPEEKMHLINQYNAPMWFLDKIPKRTVNVLEALSLLHEDFDERYRRGMEDYRNKILKYLRKSDKVRDYLTKIDVKSVFKKSNKIEKEKALLAKAINNLVKNYTGKVTEIQVPTLLYFLSNWVVWAYTRRPYYNKVLTALAQIKEPWASAEDLISTISSQVDDRIFAPPLKSIHLATMLAAHAIYTIFKDYTTNFSRMRTLRPILPSITGSINNILGLLPYFLFVIPVDGEPRVDPRITQYLSFDFMRDCVAEPGRRLLAEYECGIFDSVFSKWKDIRMFKRDHSKPSLTLITFWLEQYMRFYEILISLEEKAMEGEFTCPFCKSLAQDYLGIEFWSAFKNGFFLKNSVDLISVLFEAAETLPFYLEEELSKIEKITFYAFNICKTCDI